jgi:hypothetical protein
LRGRVGRLNTLRTVTAALRAMGLADDKHLTNYHRVPNRDRWSPWVLSKLLLALIIHLCLPAGAPLILAIDDTLEPGIAVRRRSSRSCPASPCGTGGVWIQCRFGGYCFAVLKTPTLNPEPTFAPTPLSPPNKSSCGSLRAGKVRRKKESPASSPKDKDHAQPAREEESTGDYQHWR